MTQSNLDAVKTTAATTPGSPRHFDAGYVARVIGLLALGWALIYADRTALYPLMPVLANDFQLSAAQTGAINSAYFIFYALVQIPTGIAGDRFGLRRVLAVMCVVAGVGLAGLALVAGSYGMILMMSAIHAIGAGAYYPAAYGTAMYTIPANRRGLSTAIINSGMAVGLALGLAASGPLYLLTQDWRFPFLVLSVPTVLIGGVYLFALRETHVGVRQGGSIFRVFGDRDMILLGIINFCCLYGFWTAVTWGSAFFQTERGLGLGVAGAYTAIIAVVSIPPALLVGRISDRTGRKKLVLLILPLSAIAVAGLAIVQSLPALIAMLVLYGLTGKLVWDPLGTAWAADHTLARNPNLMGSAMGFFNLAGMSSAIFAPVVSGWIKDVTGSLEGAFFVGAGAIIVAFILTWLPREARLQVAAQPETA